MVKKEQFKGWELCSFSVLFFAKGGRRVFLYCTLSPSLDSWKPSISQACLHWVESTFIWKYCAFTNYFMSLAHAIFAMKKICLVGFFVLSKDKLDIVD